MRFLMTDDSLSSKTQRMDLSNVRNGAPSIPVARQDDGGNEHAPADHVNSTHHSSVVDIPAADVVLAREDD